MQNYLRCKHSTIQNKTIFPRVKTLSYLHPAVEQRESSVCSSKPCKEYRTYALTMIREAQGASLWTGEAACRHPQGEVDYSETL